MLNNKSYGFSLIELMTTVTIVIILISAAVPSLSSYVNEAKIVGASEKIKSDMEWARTLAIRTNSTLTVKFQSNATSWCYGFDDTDSDCDCTTNSCTVNNSVKNVSSQNFDGTSMSIALNNGISSLILTNRGMSNTRGIITLAGGSKEARISINSLGRAHVCSNQLYQFTNCN